MKIREALGASVRQLREAGVDSSRLDASLLLGAILDRDRAWLIAHNEEDLAPEALKKLRRLIDQRSQHCPLAYLLGQREFFGRQFLVNGDVLIPRPETELLVDIALARLPEAELRALDLCCGSGCIGLSLAAERERWQLMLSDLSEGALAVARENGRRLLPDAQQRLQFIAGDLYQAIPAAARFDLIVCNPPYIHPDEAGDLSAEVHDHEPHAALFCADPLALIEAIAVGAAERLCGPQLLLIESSPRYAAAGANRIHDHFQAIEVISDLSGRERVILAQGVSKTQRV